MKHKHWPWVISTNFAEGLPYAVITSLSVVMLADMGLGNAEVAAWTSLLAMPWSLKALWSPVVEVWRSKRWWLWVMQLLLACCFAGIALALGTAHWLTWTLAALAVGAFASATYDVACDGFYMQVLDSDAQAYFVGIRSTAYRLSMIVASGLLTTLVGLLTVSLGAVSWAWTAVMALLAVVFVVMGAAHGCLLPRPQRVASAPVAATFRDTVRDFLHKRDLLFILCFLLFYRLGEALLSKMTILFLKAPVALGGLGLDNAEYGLIYGTVGVGALTVGGIVGGMLVSKYGLRRCVVPLALALNVPDLLYVWMASAQPDGRLLIGTLVGLEQLGYGLGFTAYMVFMLRAAQGRFATAHYAILTALMAIGMNLPSMLSGWMQEHLGYEAFFWTATAATLPGIALSFILCKRLPLEDR